MALKHFFDLSSAVSIASVFGLHLLITYTTELNTCEAFDSDMFAKDTSLLPSKAISATDNFPKPDLHTKLAC